MGDWGWGQCIQDSTVDSDYVSFRMITTCGLRTRTRKLRWYRWRRGMSSAAPTTSAFSLTRKPWLEDVDL